MLTITNTFTASDQHTRLASFPTLTHLHNLPGVPIQSFPHTAASTLRTLPSRYAASPGFAALDLRPRCLAHVLPGLAQQDADAWNAVGSYVLEECGAECRGRGEGGAGFEIHVAEDTAWCIVC